MSSTDEGGPSSNHVGSIDIVVLLSWLTVDLCIPPPESIARLPCQKKLHFQHKLWCLLCKRGLLNLVEIEQVKSSRASRAWR